MSQFRLMGQEFRFSITKFNLAFGFIDQGYAESREYVKSACDFIESFFFYHAEIWKEISVDGDRYDPSRSKSFYLKDPNFCYVQCFLAYSYSSRKDSSSTFSKPKFFFIWCMKRSTKVNLGC